MSLVISVTFTDTANGTTTDTFTLNDTDAGTFLSVLSAANPGQQQQLPLTYDALYHRMAKNFWLGLQARVQSIQINAAVTQAQASVTALNATTQPTTTPAVKAAPPVTP